MTLGALVITTNHTRETAYKLINNKIGSDTTKLNRLKAFVSECEKWSEDLELTGVDTETLLVASCLLDVGKYVETTKSNIVQYDSFRYLKLNNYSDDVCSLVLNHLNSRDMIRPVYNDIEHEYNKELSDNLNLLSQILSVVEFTLNSEGEHVTIQERMLELEVDLAEETTILNHLNDLSYKVAMWYLDLKFRN